MGNNIAYFCFFCSRIFLNNIIYYSVPIAAIYQSVIDTFCTLFSFCIAIYYWWLTNCVKKTIPKKISTQIFFMPIFYE